MGRARRVAPRDSPEMRCDTSHFGVGSHPADGGVWITLPLTSAPTWRSSSFVCFLLRQPLPADMGGGINGGSMGNPASAPSSGDAADASWTGV